MTTKSSAAGELAANGRRIHLDESPFLNPPCPIGGPRRSIIDHAGLGVTIHDGYDE